jgi:hypothetical protein
MMLARESNPLRTSRRGVGGYLLSHAVGCDTYLDCNNARCFTAAT